MHSPANFLLPTALNGDRGVRQGTAVPVLEPVSSSQPPQERKRLIVCVANAWRAGFGGRHTVKASQARALGQHHDHRRHLGPSSSRGDLVVTCTLCAASSFSGETYGHGHSLIIHSACPRALVSLSRQAGCTPVGVPVCASTRVPADITRPRCRCAVHGPRCQCGRVATERARRRRTRGQAGGPAVGCQCWPTMAGPGL